MNFDHKESYSIYGFTEKLIFMSFGFFPHPKIWKVEIYGFHNIAMKMVSLPRELKIYSLYNIYKHKNVYRSASIYIYIWQNIVLQLVWKKRTSKISSVGNSQLLVSDNSIDVRTCILKQASMCEDRLHV